MGVLQPTMKKLRPVGGRWAPGSELQCSFGWTLFLTRRRPVQRQNKCLPSIRGFKDHVSTVPHHYERVSLNSEGTEVFLPNHLVQEQVSGELATGTGSLGRAKETQAARCSRTCGGGLCVGKTRERATTCPVTKEFVRHSYSPSQHHRPGLVLVSLLFHHLSGPTHGES